LAPDPINSTQFIPGGNVPANGGKLFFYVSNTSTKQTVYKDSAAAVAHTNPLVLDSGGNIPSGGEVWFPTGETFKVVFAPSTDTDPPISPYWTKDTLSGMNDVSTVISEWVTGPVPSFIGTTSFSIVGDQTATFQVNRWVKTTNTGGTVYSRISASVFGALTTVTVVNDSGVLDSGLSAVSYGLLSATNPSVPVLIDTRPLLSGSADKSKLLRLEIDGFTTSTTRVLTPPNADLTLPNASTAGTIPIATSTGVLGMVTALNNTGFGLTLSNGTDAINDTNIAAGGAMDNTGTYWMTLATAMGKQLDVAWAVGGTTGTPAGGRMSAAAIANTTYHMYLIARPDTGVVDSGFDVSPTAPTLPTNYTKAVRIGSIIRESASTVAFSQFGDEFLRSAGVLDVSANNPGTNAVTRTLSVPTGIVVKAIVNWESLNAAAGVNFSGYISSLSQSDQVPSLSAAPLVNLGGYVLAATTPEWSAEIRTRTNTSAAVRSRMYQSDASCTLYGSTVGWIDTRWKDGQ
jgi:hypothetical protein